MATSDPQSITAREYEVGELPDWEVFNAAHGFAAETVFRLAEGEQ